MLLISINKNKNNVLRPLLALVLPSLQIAASCPALYSCEIREIIKASDNN